MKKFEYFTVENATPLTDNSLNKRGKEGWELISHAVITHEDDNTLYYEHYYVFKREILKNTI